MRKEFLSWKFLLILFLCTAFPHPALAETAMDASGPPQILYGSVEGKVWDFKSKKTIPDALVRIERGTFNLNGKTDKDGRYQLSQLPLGKYTIVAEKEGYYPTQGSITVTAASPLQVNIELKAKTGFLDGVVRNQENKPIKGVEVSLAGTDYKTHTDNDGAYVFNDLPEREYNLFFFHKDYLADTTRKVLVFENSITTAKVILQPNVAGQVTGKVIDSETTEPLVDVEVKVEAGENVVTDYTKADGSFILKGLAPGRYRVTLSREGYNTKISSVLVSDKVGKAFNFTMTPLSQ